MRRWGACTLVAALLVGCGGDDSSSSGGDAGPPAPCVPGERLVGQGCLPAGVQDDGCEAGQLAGADGACSPAGVPPTSCGRGFEADDAGGCVAILPAEPCPEATFAVPGEASCHEIMP